PSSYQAWVSPSGVSKKDGAGAAGVMFSALSSLNHSLDIGAAQAAGRQALGDEAEAERGERRIDRGGDAVKAPEQDDFAIEIVGFDRAGSLHETLGCGGADPVDPRHGAHLHVLGAAGILLGAGLEGDAGG